MGMTVPPAPILNRPRAYAESGNQPVLQEAKPLPLAPAPVFAPIQTEFPQPPAPPVTAPHPHATGDFYDPYNNKKRQGGNGKYRMNLF